MARYKVHYGSQHSTCKLNYCVWDSDERDVSFESNSKTITIAAAQKLSGFTPVDGLESTYDRQVRRTS